MKSVKCMIQERTINGLRADLEKLEAENTKLKQNENAVQEAIQQYQSAISEAKEIKAKYDAAIKNIEVMKKNYRREMDALLARLRKQVKS